MPEAFLKYRLTLLHFKKCLLYLDLSRENKSGQGRKGEKL